MNNINKIIMIILAALLLFACKEEKKILTPEEQEYTKQIEHIRTQIDRWMRTNPDSPFNGEYKVEFHPLNYYEPNMDFIFKSKLNEYSSKDTVKVYGTSGEIRTFVRYGYFDINYKNKIHKLNLYVGRTADGKTYPSIWFTDETTNDETYGVGRYLNIRLVNDPDHIYTIDFNAAYNPYCAYSKDYSCAIPLKEDHLNFAVEAGEKKFHD